MNAFSALLDCAEAILTESTYDAERGAYIVSEFTVDALRAALAPFYLPPKKDAQK